MAALSAATPASPLRPLQVLAPVAVAGASAALVGLRYGLQGTGNVYTDTARAFYLQDPLLGWSLSSGRWVWLGLDALALVVAVGLGTAVTALLAGALARRHRAGRVARPWATGALLAFWVGAALCALTPIVPIAAFASGMPPAGMAATMPTDVRPALAAPTEAAAAPIGWPELPAGAWTVLPHPEANALVAQLVAGGETFDARFGPIGGQATLVPADLLLTTAQVSAPAASIDAGVPLRTSHARADLRVDAFPELTVRVDRLARLAHDGPGAVRFEAEAEVGVMGATLRLPISGRVARLDAEARRTLGLTVDVALLVQATLDVPLARTPLGADAFDRDTAAVSARFILAPQP